MKLSRLFSPPPFDARHYKRTYIACPPDEAPATEIIEGALAFARKTLTVDIDDVCRRMPPAAWRPEVWPGEHYRLLAGIVAELQPKTVVEIGTHTGLSALALLKYLPPAGRLVTFDLIPWDQISGTCLRSGDFAPERFAQEIADLANPAVFTRHAALLSAADLIFVDGPKDKKFEPALAALLDTLSFAQPPWVVFDDSYDLNMLRFWRELKKPKLDITSLGHWTGTGMVRWN